MWWADHVSRKPARGRCWCCKARMPACPWALRAGVDIIPDPRSTQSSILPSWRSSTTWTLGGATAEQTGRSSFSVVKVENLKWGNSIFSDGPQPRGQGPPNADETEYSIPYLPFFFSLCTGVLLMIRYSRLNTKAYNVTEDLHLFLCFLRTCRCMNAICQLSEVQKLRSRASQATLTTDYFCCCRFVCIYACIAVLLTFIRE